MHKHALLLALALHSGACVCAADWPQRAHDPQRTARSPDSPQPPFKTAWQRLIPDERIGGWNEPIVAEGKVFIGTIEGVMHCWPLAKAEYDQRKGADLWSFQTGGPILQAAAYADGRVYLGSADGCCYALNAADGTVAWKTDVGRPGFSQAALVAEGKVFMGSRAGVFHAFDAATGRVLWRHDAGAPYLASAAWHDGVVYAAAEDMIVRALDAGTGKPLWESAPLHGSGVLEYYPIVDAGKIILRTKPYSLPATAGYSYSISERDESKPPTHTGWHNMPNGGPEIADAFWRNQDTPRAARLAGYNAGMRAAFEADPRALTFHVLDAATGKRAFIAPIIYNMVNVGTAIPPTVGPDGFWYAPTTMSARGNECEVVKVDPRTGDIVDVLQEYVGGYDRDGWGGAYHTVMPDGSLSEELFLERGWTGDENNHFSVGGTVLFGRHAHGGWDGLDLVARVPFGGKPYASQYERSRVMFPGNGFSPLVISGRYLVGTQISGAGAVFCVEGRGGE